MNLKKSNGFIWIGLVLIILNFVSWIFFRGSDSSLMITKGFVQYYLELFFWLIVLNIPAIVILFIGIIARKKAKRNAATAG